MTADARMLSSASTAGRSRHGPGFAPASRPGGNRCVPPHWRHYPTAIKLTDELVLSLLPKRTRKAGGHDHTDVRAWKKVIEGHAELLGTRRRIAHHPVDTRLDVRSGTIGVGAIGLMAIGVAPVPSFEIYASAQERLRSKEADQRPIGIDDLKNHRLRVNQLNDKLRQFLARTFSPYARPIPR